MSNQQQKFVVIRRAPKKTGFSEINKLEDINQIYSTNIRGMISPFTDRFGRTITGLTEPEEKEFETLLGLSKGELSKNSPFWNSPAMRVFVDGTSSRLYIDDPMGELKYKMVKSQPIVAPSSREYNPEKHQFVMYEPELEAAIEEAKIDVELTASEEFNKMTPEQLSDMSTFYKLSTKGITNKVIRINLWKEVKKAPQKYLKLLKDPYYKTKLFVNQCVREGVIKHSNKGYFWPDELVVPIAVSMDQFVEILESKDNQEIKINLKSKLAEAKRINK